MKTKTNPSFTPGPWTYECTNAGEIGSKDKVRIEGPDGHIAIACRTKRTDKNTFGNVGIPRGLPEVKANAHLIAAAPELLHAAITMRTMIRNGAHIPPAGCVEWDIWNECLMAIAKAEGR